jgi:hypothetical protein
MVATARAETATVILVLRVMMFVLECCRLVITKR